MCFKKFEDAKLAIFGGLKGKGISQPEQTFRMKFYERDYQDKYAERD
ncbi:hypothetical protein TBC1_11558 [Lentimicrobium saccharophilum]|uniref:Uncharacterized protein n=1 Tax=Lentimicrobium saccharophilum TaxID=1678841 RepID=A0A0S7BQE9_9BACT|nr:hypothetical protein TBC1_11558 [Lentimicrobium saccharophilum]